VTLATPEPVRIPRAPGPPYEPTSILLDAVSGWRIAEQTGLHETHCCELELAQSARSLRELTEPCGSFGGLRPPRQVACGPSGDIYLLDPRALALKRFDPCACAFRSEACVARRGGGARALRGAGGITAGGGCLYICDSGLDGLTETGSNPRWNVLRARIRSENHRVSIFTLDGFGLIGHLRPPSSQFAKWKPVAVAYDTRSGIWVADQRNNCIQLFALTGHWLRAITGFNAPVQITCTVPGDFLILDHDAATDKLAVHLLHKDGTPGTAPASVAEARNWFCRLPFQVLRDGTLDLSGCCAGTGSLGFFDGAGRPLKKQLVIPPISFVPHGSFRTSALDSKILGCQWHSVALSGELPMGCSIRVETFCADQIYTDDQLDGFAVWTRVDARPAPATPAASMAPRLRWDWDALVRSAPGRYLWLRLVLRSSGKATPRLRAVVVEFPRITSMQYLPATFGAEPISADFSQRFIALFDHVMRSIETKVDTLARWFDPLSTPSRPVGDAPIDFLTWLASWIGLTLDRTWSEAKRRWLVKQAARLYPLRGTLPGLRGMLLLLLGWDRPQLRWPRQPTPRSCQPRALNCAPRPACVPYEPPPLILEHFRLRRWMRLGAERLGLEATLWGQRIVDRSQLNVNARIGKTLLLTTPAPANDPVLVHANRYTVFVPARYGAAAPRRSLENLLRAESAAYLAYDIEYVEPRMRIGVQSMIGFDSVIGRLPQGVTLDRSSLGRATVLTSAKGASPLVRVGRSSRMGPAPMQLK
jgi:phage tail-like protein